ncbi:MAG: DUF6130 family protein, partial [Bacteroidetes bacterium]|nr:DUF6130 family protein [Bacteroidota bacterium]
PSTPSLSITSPVNNATLYGNSATINFAVQNFIIGNPGTGIDGHIHYTVDGGSVVMYYTTAPITITGLAVGAHTVILQLVDNTHTPLNPDVTATVTFNMVASPPNLHTIHDVQ